MVAVPAQRSVTMKVLATSLLIGAASAWSSPFQHVLQPPQEASEAWTRPLRNLHESLKSLTVSSYPAGHSIGSLCQSRRWRSNLERANSNIHCREKLAQYGTKSLISFPRRWTRLASFRSPRSMPGDPTIIGTTSSRVPMYRAYGSRMLTERWKERSRASSRPTICGRKRSIRAHWASILA